MTTEALVRVIREFRPHVLLTYDETGGYPHPDHVNCHVVVDVRVRRGRRPRRIPPRRRALAAAEAVLPPDDDQGADPTALRPHDRAGIETDYGDWLKDWKRPDREVTTRVECAEYFDIRDRALLAHATQVDPDGGWFHTPRGLVREGWPTEEYELVVSYAPVQLPEDDLFAGLGSVREADALAAKAGLVPVRDVRPDPQGAVKLAGTSGPAG